MGRLCMALAAMCVGCGDVGDSAASDTTGGADSSTGSATTGAEASSQAPSTTEGSSSGPQTGSGSTSGSSSSSGPSLCGNGDVDPGEDCDDENRVAGDFCLPDCSEPLVQSWVRTYVGSPGLDDAVWGVAINGDGDVGIAAQQASGVADTRWRTGVFRSGDGSSIWGVSSSGAVTSLQRPGRAVFLADGTLVVVGEKNISGDLDIVVEARDATGATAWSTFVPGSTDDDLAHRIAVDPMTGDILVCGAVIDTVLDQRRGWWGRLSAADGALLDSVTIGTDATFALAQGIGADDAGNVTVVVQEADSFFYGVVVRYDAMGNETVLIDPLPEITIVQDMHVFGDGGFVLAGVQPGGGDAGVAVVARYDSTGVLQWQDAYNGPHSGGLDVYASIAVSAAGDIYVAGQHEVGILDSDALVAKFAPGGERQWLAAPYEDDEPQFEEIASTIAVSGSGVVVLGGSDGTLTEALDGWAALFEEQ